MFQIIATCGHCNHKVPLRFRKALSFHPHIDRPDPNDPNVRMFQNKGLRGERLVDTLEDEQVGDAAALAICQTCGQPSLLLFKSKFSNFRRMAENLDNERPHIGGQDLVKVKKIYPQPKQPVVLDGWPDEIVEQFADVQQMLHEGKHPSLIISPCRSILDIVTKKLGGKKNRLIDRIDELLEQNIITKPLAEWAHQLRLDGNEAVHELQGTREEAEQYVAFLRMLMELAFSLPERIKKRTESSTHEP